MRKLFFRKRMFLFVVVFSTLFVSCAPLPPIATAGFGDDEEELTEFGEVNLSDEQDGGSESESDYDPEAPPLPGGELPSPWKEFTDAPLQNMPGNRSEEAYLAVLLQFGVDQDPCRYTKPCGGPDYTRCNIYASDVMNAMGAHLPTKGELGVGQHPYENTDRMPANAIDTHNWLEQEKDGWRKLDPNNPNDWALLQAHLAAGKPALASHPDHIAVIRPDQPNGLAVGDTGGLHIAQSGAYNSNDTLVGKAFGNRTVDVYIHE